MNYPTQKNEPQDDGEHEMGDSHTKAPLKKLSQSWDKETAQGSEHIAPRTLSRHRQILHGEVNTGYCLYGRVSTEQIHRTKPLAASCASDSARKAQSGSSKPTPSAYRLVS